LVENTLGEDFKGKTMRVAIVGGVAGGASCAARLRRLSEEAEITIFDRGPFVSFANCGLPYYVGNIIDQEAKLLMATPAMFLKRFNIAVKLNCDVSRIDRDLREIEVIDLKSGEHFRHPYDALVLSPGASPIRPPLPGIDLPGIFTLRGIPDSRQIRQWITQRKAQKAVVVGGGFIGMEMAENLVRRALAVTLVEMMPQVMPALDPEMTVPLQDELTRNGVKLHLGQAVLGFAQEANGGLVVQLQDGTSETADLVLLAIGVRPETTLARDAGLELGALGGIRVDDQMRSSDPRIWAVGDAVEVKDVVTGGWGLVPLAGPANRQGRIAADVIAGRPARFRGVQATAICAAFGMTIASTGCSEKALKRLGLWDQPKPCEKIYLHPGHHAGYYPGAMPITIKLIFHKSDGRILGAQAVGPEGIDKRMDVIAMAIQMQATVFDLEEAELCYSPQFGSAKDPVNLAGMIAGNVLRGDLEILHSEDLEGRDSFLLDVREPLEFKADHIPGAVNISLNELRPRMSELPRDREICTYCLVGQRSYYAARALAQHGFRVRNLSGGFKSLLLKR
jgi:NADPH-dependent 2,4-dienoyl-CoA reductase/sulfur reductase-like enzyme/rhodanese-related sulfurtransferase